MAITNANMTLVEQIKSLIKSFSPDERRKNVDAAFGCLSQYANPKLHEMEKNAWEMAMRVKRGRAE